MRVFLEAQWTAILGILVGLIPSFVWMVVHRVVPAARSRAGVLVLSAATTALQFRERLPAWILVLGFAAAAVSHLARLPEAGGARWNRARWMMWFLTALFVVIRIPSVRSSASSGFPALFPGLVLDMLVFLRLLTGLWEVGCGRVRTPDVQAVWAWLMMPWSGALVRLSEFQSQWSGLVSGPPPPWRYGDMGRHAADLLAHVAVWLVLSAATWWINTHIHARAVLLAWGTFVSSPVLFYMGSHMTARSHQMVAAVAGFRIQDNYRLPIGRPNISEFWANWNITHTNVFRDLLFYQRWGLKKANIHLNSMILFVLVGLWHDQNRYWVIWGLLHGLGFCAYLQWKHRIRPRLKWRWLDGTWTARWIATGITHAFVCLCWFLPPQFYRFLP